MILDEEQSVKAPIIESLITTKFQTEVRAMQNRIKQGQLNIDQTNEKLAQIKQQEGSPKEQAVSNTLKTKANQKLYLNSNSNSNQRKKT